MNKFSKRTRNPAFKVVTKDIPAPAPYKYGLKKAIDRLVRSGQNVAVPNHQSVVSVVLCARCQGSYRHMYRTRRERNGGTRIWCL